MGDDRGAVPECTVTSGVGTHNKAAGKLGYL